MGSWLTSLINSQQNADDLRKDPHAIAAYTLLLGLAILVVLLWSAILILTTIRICKKLHNKPKPYTADTENVSNDKTELKILRSLRRSQESDLEMIELRTSPNPTAHRYKSHVLGVKLRASHETDRLGEPGIFVDKVRPGSIADGKLFPGDRIVAVNDFSLKQVTLQYAKDVIQALQRAEGRLRFCVKKAPPREQRVNEAFSMYFDDEETGKKVIFNEEHVAVFEDAFSLFDERNSGRISMKHLSPLLRSLGYNIHQSEVWDHMNELSLADQPTIHFTEFIKLLEQVVGDQKSSSEVHAAYNVFDPDQRGHVTLYELQEAIVSLPGRRKFTEEDIKQILSLADQDDDGRVTKEDFERLLLPSLTLY